MSSHVNSLAPTISEIAAPQPRTIPFFNYARAFAEREDEYVGLFRSVLRRGAFIQQQELADFERRLAAYLGVLYAFGVANATDGLIIAWRAIGLPAGAEVILPSHTMVATAAAIHFAGGVPVPVDIDDENLIDPLAIEAAINERTVGISPVQLNGRTARMDRIMAIAEQHGLTVIEDAAQALGSRFRGRFAGTFGRAGVFSFYPAKILGCMGDGGAIVTNDAVLARRITLLRDHGRDEQGNVACWGLNSRLDNLQAGILDLQFRDYDRIIAHRRALAASYDALLRNVPQLELPPAPGSDADHFDVFQNYELQADNRDELREYLRANGIGTLVQWGGHPVHQHTGLGYQIHLPRTERFFGRCLMLPMNLTVSLADTAHIAARIREFYA